jgi:hypothetical protein
MTPPESWNPDEAWSEIGKDLNEGIDFPPEESVHKPKH